VEDTSHQKQSLTCRVHLPKTLVAGFCSIAAKNCLQFSPGPYTRGIADMRPPFFESDESILVVVHPIESVLRRTLKGIFVVLKDCVKKIGGRAVHSALRDSFLTKDGDYE
jgi:hypothetical protein